MERIGIIGSGRAGGALGAALASAGYPVTGVSARSRASRERAARLLPHVPVLEPAEVVGRADVVLLAVPDDAIAAVARTLPFTEDQYAVHLSGAHGISVLRGIAATPVALHPPMTFTDAPTSLAGVVFTATAPDHALVERLVKDLGAEVQWVAEEQRALYHAGLVHGANHLVTLVGQALDVLRTAGIADPSATLRPLLTATLDNTLRSGHDALTGPIVRGDVETVQAHLAVLQGRVASTYAELARATVELAAANGRLDAATARRLGEVLDEAAPDGARLDAAVLDGAGRAQVLERDRTGEAPR